MELASHLLTTADSYCLQDAETATAIGSKSYNALVAGIAEFRSGKPTEENKHVEEETVDFAAATTAALKIPSPSVSRGRSFGDHTLSNSVVHEAHKGRGDREEAAELASALNQSKAESGLLLTYHIAILHPPNQHRKVRGMRVLLSCLTQSSKAVLPLMTRQRNVRFLFFFSVIDFCTCINLFVQCENYYIWLHT